MMQACIALVEKKIPYNLLLAKKAEKPNEFEELYQAGQDNDSA